MTTEPTPVAMPPNEGNLPLERTYDEHGYLVGIRIAWKGHTIREQFPWTRSVTHGDLTTPQVT